MAIKSKQIFQLIVIQFDDAIFDEKYTHEAGGKVAKIKIVKKSDPNYFIEIDLFNGWIDWYSHYPIPNNITQTKGLTVMVLS